LRSNYLPIIGGLKGIVSKVTQGESAKLWIWSRFASRPATAFACELESVAAGAARTRLFCIASKIGLSADATKLVHDQYGLHAKLLHEAYLVLRELIPRQQAKAAWRRSRRDAFANA
jgi:hypothetical protein